jgi:three-Cys-motif partner protein
MTEPHAFGGRHTDDKLNRLVAYMAAFTTALKNQSFTLLYIDAFAGSGGRAEERPALPLFDGDSSAQVVTVPGSARLALEVDPPFDILVLIEEDNGRFASLENLAAEFPQQRVILHHGDANGAVRKLCADIPWHNSGGNTKGVRGVLFLDPYGMEVEWPTIEEVAASQAIDAWIFFPLSGLYRNAPHDKLKITEDKRRRITAVLGTDDWEKSWYDSPASQGDLFGDEATAIRTVDVDAIEEYVRKRLATVFKGAVMKPIRIYNERGAPIASLFFAVSNPNPKAVGLAKRIADSILKQ